MKLKYIKDTAGESAEDFVLKNVLKEADKKGFITSVKAALIDWDEVDGITVFEISDDQVNNSKGLLELGFEEVKEGKKSFSSGAPTFDRENKLHIGSLAYLNSMAVSDVVDNLRKMEKAGDMGFTEAEMKEFAKEHNKTIDYIQKSPLCVKYTQFEGQTDLFFIDDILPRDKRLYSDDGIESTVDNPGDEFAEFEGMDNIADIQEYFDELTADEELPNITVIGVSITGDVTIKLGDSEFVIESTDEAYLLTKGGDVIAESDELDDLLENILSTKKSFSKRYRMVGKHKNKIKTPAEAKKARLKRIKAKKEQIKEEKDSNKRKKLKAELTIELVKLKTLHSTQDKSLFSAKNSSQLRDAFQNKGVSVDIQHFSTFDNSGFLTTYDNLSQDELEKICSKIPGFIFTVSKPIKSVESGYYLMANFIDPDKDFEIGKKLFSLDTELSEDQLSQTIDSLISKVEADDHDSEKLFITSLKSYKERYPEASTVKDVIEALEKDADETEESKFKMFLGGLKGIAKLFSDTVDYEALGILVIEESDEEAKVEFLNGSAKLLLKGLAKYEDNLQTQTDYLSGDLVRVLLMIKESKGVLRNSTYHKYTFREILRVLQVGAGDKVNYGNLGTSNRKMFSAISDMAALLPEDLAGDDFDKVLKIAGSCDLSKDCIKNSIKEIKEITGEELSKEDYTELVKMAQGKKKGFSAGDYSSDQEAVAYAIADMIENGGLDNFIMDDTLSYESDRSNFKKLLMQGCVPIYMDQGNEALLVTVKAVNPRELTQAKKAFSLSEEAKEFYKLPGVRKAVKEILTKGLPKIYKTTNSWATRDTLCRFTRWDGCPTGEMLILNVEVADQVFKWLHDQIGHANDEMLDELWCAFEGEIYEAIPSEFKQLEDCYDQEIDKNVENMQDKKTFSTRDGKYGIKCDSIATARDVYEILETQEGDLDIQGKELTFFSRLSEIQIKNLLEPVSNSLKLYNDGLKLLFSAGNIPTAYSIEDRVSYIPMAHQLDDYKIIAEPRDGTIVGIRATRSKIMYDVLDDSLGNIFYEVTSDKIQGELGQLKVGMSTSSRLKFTFSKNDSDMASKLAEVEKYWESASKIEILQLLSSSSIDPTKEGFNYRSMDFGDLPEKVRIKLANSHSKKEFSDAMDNMPAGTSYMKKTYNDVDKDNYVDPASTLKKGIMTYSQGRLTFSVADKGIMKSWDDYAVLKKSVPEESTESLGRAVGYLSQSKIKGAQFDGSAEVSKVLLDFTKRLDPSMEYTDDWEGTSFKNKEYKCDLNSLDMYLVVTESDRTGEVTNIDVYVNDPIAFETKFGAVIGKKTY